MKPLIRWMPALALFAALMQWNGTTSAQIYSEDGDFGNGTEQHAVLTIKADGSCLFLTETVESRTVAEQQERIMERIQKMSESADEGVGETPAQTDLSSTNATKLYSDEELTRKIAETMNERAGESAEDSDQKLNVEIKKDTVLIITTRSFASIEEMLQNSDAIWSQSGVIFENVRFEIDTNDNLRITLTPRSGMGRYLKNIRSEWKLRGVKSELKLVFPGRVISSGFPAMQTNATWLAVNAEQDESLDAVAKLYAAPTVITAESGGLKLASPLESKSLRRSSRERDEAGNDLPITDAGPGFVAEAQSITTTTLHVFPGGEDYFNQNANSLRLQTGAVVNAKLFAPKGRTLLSVSDVRVFTARDDKGRSVAAEPEDSENVQSEFNSGNSSDVGSLNIQLPLQLPQPDAQAIDEISAEAVTVTAGTWKEMTLTNLQENTTNELDLADVLPGAKMVITKLSSKNGQFNLQARLQGSRTVQRLDVRAKIPGNDSFNSYSSERRFNIKGGEATRGLTIQGYGLGDTSSQGSIVLIVRYPEDLRRERVKINLKGLDLF